MTKEYQQLERDIQRQAQQLRQQSPDAARELRDGLSQAQQAEAGKIMEYGADYIARGSQDQIGRWMKNEETLANSMQKLQESVRDAQRNLGDGKQQQANGQGLDDQVRDVENLRAQLERMQQQAAQRGQGQQKGQGQQPGQQGQQGKDGQGKDGQGKDGQGQGKDGQGQQGQGQGQGQQGQQAQQGGGQGGGQQTGGAGGYDRYGRYNPQGIYDRPGAAPVDPREIVRDAQRDLRNIQQANRDNREIAGQAAALERELQNLAVGNPSGPELEARLSRTILPQLESLEVQLRQQADAAEGGQVRNPGTERAPAGYAPDVAEYYRRLSRSK
jgi:hypothetical protein